MTLSNVRLGSWQRLALVFAVAGSSLLMASAPKGAKAKAAKKDASATVAAAAAPQAAASASSGAGENAFRPSRMQGSLLGTPGIWSTQFAETLLPGQASTGVYFDRYSRDPGGMVITEGHQGWTVGLTKWLEVSFDTTSYRRIRMTHPGELTYGTNGTLGSFNPVAPFVRNPLLTGPVDWGLGLTFGLLSQDRGDPIGLAFQVEEHFPYNPDLTNGVNFFGVGTTEPRFNENLLIDKWLGQGEIAFNVGYQHNGTVDAGGVINLPLRDQFTYQFGEIFPIISRVQGVVELGGNVPFGAGATSNLYGEPRPLDLNVGLRINPLSFMGINAGYRLGAHSSSGIAPITNPNGWVFGVSFGPPPPAPAPPPPPPTPTLACKVDASPVTPGTTVHISSTVSPEGLPYTYSWTTTGGTLSPAGASATLDTANLAPGLYTITGRVDNGSGGTNECTTSVEVREPVRNPPTAACSVEPTTPVLPGTALAFSVQASSPDNRPLTYTWVTSPAGVGHLDATDQAAVHLDTTGAPAGPVHATAKVTDDRGLSALCSVDGTIAAPPPPPQAALASTLQFAPNSSRVDNAAKAALDDVALRLQQDANATAVVVGSATPNEVARRRALTPAATEKLAQQRAENVQAYLVKEKGISADRIQLRYATDNAHQAEVWVVPQGASYTGTGQSFTPASK